MNLLATATPHDCSLGSYATMEKVFKRIAIG